MKKYIVNITDKAISDLSEIVNYISDSLFAPDAAHRLYIRIADEIESLWASTAPTSASSSAT